MIRYVSKTEILRCSINTAKQVYIMSRLTWEYQTVNNKFGNVLSVGDIFTGMNNDMLCISYKMQRVFIPINFLVPRWT